MSTKYPREDWQYEVANQDTVLGYEEWVRACQESDGKLTTRDQLLDEILLSLNRMFRVDPHAIPALLMEFGQSVERHVMDDPHMVMPDAFTLRPYGVLQGLIHELTGRYVMLKYRGGEPIGFRPFPKNKPKKDLPR